MSRPVSNLPLPFLLAVAGVVGLVAGWLLSWLLSRRWLADARAAGHASRDAEVAMLVAQRDAAAGEAGALQARVARYERDWTQAEQNLRKLTAHAATQQAQAERLGHELADARRGRDDAQVRLVELTRTHAALEAGAQAQAQAAAEKLQLLEQAEQRLRESFQNLANQILDAKAERMREQNSEQLGHLLDPLRTQIGDFRKLVSESYEKENNARVALQTQVAQLFDLNQKLSHEANSLARALTTENRTQGYWGELRLERLLETSGLARGSEYVTQESFVDADGDRYRPDAIVRLPEGKDVVIDAKVALVAYRESCDAADEAAREQALARHVAAMRAHVRGLGDKNYAQLQGVSAPDLVLMFVPVEAAFLEALRRDAALYEDAYARRIVIVGPSNLLASLRLIAHLWRTDQQNRNARAIAERAATLYDKFVGFVADLNKVGKSLDDAQGQYRQALGKLSQGRGNLVRQAEMLRELGVSPSKQLPAALLDLDGGEAEDGSPPPGDAAGE